MEKWACGFWIFWRNEQNVRWLQLTEKKVAVGSRVNERIKWLV